MLFRKVFAHRIEVHPAGGSRKAAASRRGRTGAWT